MMQESSASPTGRPARVWTNWTPQSSRSSQEKMKPAHLRSHRAMLSLLVLCLRLPEKFRMQMLKSAAVMRSWTRKTPKSLSIGRRVMLRKQVEDSALVASLPKSPMHQITPMVSRWPKNLPMKRKMCRRIKAGLDSSIFTCSGLGAETTMMMRCKWLKVALPPSKIEDGAGRYGSGSTQRSMWMMRWRTRRTRKLINSMLLRLPRFKCLSLKA
mmetsp:Transcript_42989/g.98764  ORF Transcript_42989/g.98764 Transcript_42989/m.98764 type:complete len:213 (+) Transcript_42989:1746-2384(+)